MDSMTQPRLEGTVTEVAERLYEQLITGGSSLLLSDVVGFVLETCRDYVAWAGVLRSIHLQTDETDLPLSMLLDDTTPLYNDEWSIMKPVVQARCDVLQASRMEGVQNMGVQPNGMGASEAKQNLREAIMQMKKEAFNCHAFSVEWTDLPKDKRVML